jgi:hypothetical protein
VLQDAAAMDHHPHGADDDAEAAQQLPRTDPPGGQLPPSKPAKHAWQLPAALAVTIPTEAADSASAAGVGAAGLPVSSNARSFLAEPSKGSTFFTQAGARLLQRTLAWLMPAGMSA